jgi:hypothetical protein
VPAPLASLVEAVAALIDALETAGVDYALGGAVAYSAWAEPRATRDVDVNVWIPLERLDTAFDVLARAGVLVDRAAARAEAEARGMFVGRRGEYRVDVFIPSVPFYEEARGRRVRTRVAGRDTWVLSAETLAVFKVLFFRPKDLADVGRLLEIQGGRFDHAFVRHWLVEMLGRDDERVLAWDRLVIDHSRG